jgi:peptidoglycan/LPS O-acetylase OafA/YrhL
VAAAAVAAVTAMALIVVSAFLPLWFAGIAWQVATFAPVVLPIAIGIAITRYRLYEIDRLVSRSIGWVAVTSLLLGAFVLLVVALQAIAEPLTGGDTVATAASTLVVAALFTPLRSRVQRAVDRRFDRARYDGQRILAAFGEQVRDEVDLATIQSDVLVTVGAAVRPVSAGLWLRTDGPR